MVGELEQPILTFGTMSQILRLRMRSSLRKGQNVVLFKWIGSWFSPKDEYSFYFPGEMSIYHYWDGQKKVSADPMTLYKKLMSVGPELAVDIQVANSTLVKNEDSIKANNSLIRKIREIFSVKSYEEGGLTEAATANLLDHFLIYTEVVKKNSNPSLTSSTLEDSKVSSVESQPIIKSSESGSTEKGSSTDVLESSTSELESLSV